MDMKEKKGKLFELYAEFEQKAGSYLQAAVCARGCADCCTNVGEIDATTLEGLVILGHIQDLPADEQKRFEKSLKANRKARTKSTLARCAFLLEDNSCGIYPVRPFSCRRLYSVKTCSESGPTLSRQYWALSQEALGAIQQLDAAGYSGYVSQILTLLKDARFRKSYLQGHTTLPGAIPPFARPNRVAVL
jgi:uncharacterized protein